jgi:hypothetical protein
MKHTHLDRWTCASVKLMISNHKWSPRHWIAHGWKVWLGLCLQGTWNLWRKRTEDQLYYLFYFYFILIFIFLFSSSFFLSFLFFSSFFLFFRFFCFAFQNFCNIILIQHLSKMMWWLLPHAWTMLVLKHKRGGNDFSSKHKFHNLAEYLNLIENFTPYWN